MASFNRRALLQIIITFFFVIGKERERDSDRKKKIEREREREKEAQRRVESVAIIPKCKEREIKKK